MALSVTGLTAETDSGLLGDLITNNSTPTIYGIGVAGDTVEIYYNPLIGSPVKIGSALVGSDDSWTSSLQTLPEGVASLTLKQMSLLSTIPVNVVNTALTIDLTAPFAPLTPTLDINSDSGIKGDLITNNTKPTINNILQLSNLVNVYDNNVLVGTVQPGLLGSTSFSFPTALAAGNHSITETYTDLAGNQSAMSGALNITVQTQLPAAPSTPTLAPISDTGVKGDGITSALIPVIVGTAIPGNLVTVYLNNQQVDQVVADLNGNWAYTPVSTLQDAQYSITATQTDGVGNTSVVSSAFQINTDSHAPNAPTTPVLSSQDDTGIMGDGTTSVKQPTFTGTAEAASTISILSNGQSIGTTQADAQGNWSFKTPALTDGSFLITAESTDAAGNTSSNSGSFSLTVDTQAPNPTTNSGLSGDSDSGTVGDGITNKDQPVFTGNADPGSLINVFSSGVVLGTTQTDLTGNWSFTSVPLVDGVYSITTAAVDSAGNSSAQSAPIMITIDTQAPISQSAVSISANTDSGVVGDNITKNTQPVLIGKTEAGSTVNLWIDNNQPVQIQADASGNWQYSVTSGLSDGNHTIKTSATDLAGNTSAISQPSIITIDTSAPLAPSTAVLSAASDTGIKGDNITGNNQPTLTGTAEANSVINAFDATNKVIGTTITDANGMWSLTFSSALPDGMNSITTQASDRAGNLSPQSAPYQFMLDTTIPVTPTVPLLNVQTDSGTIGDGITNNTKPIIVGTAQGLNAVNIFVNNSLIGTTQADSTGNWQYGLSSTLQDGNYQVSVSSISVAGVSSMMSNALALTIDTQIPTPPVPVLPIQDNGTGATGNVTNNPTPTLTGTTSANALVMVSINNGTNTVASGTVTADAGGNWSFTEPNNLANGNYQAITTAKDAAGNLSAPSTLSFEVDTNAPAAIFVSAQAPASNVYAGDRVTFNVLMNKAVIVDTSGGNPFLILNDKDHADYVGISADGKTMIFTASLTNASQSVSKLKIIGFDLNGGKIVDHAGNSIDVIGADSVPGTSTNIVVGDPATTQAAGDVFRFFNTGDGSHFYTLSTTEKAQVLATRPDLVYEGISFKSVDNSDPNGSQLYRFFDTNNGSHFFTTSSQERDSIIGSRQDLKYEGPSFYEHITEQAGDVAVYRFFNTQNGTHLFTSDAGEMKSVAALPDYKAEGIAFYSPHS